MPPTFPNTLLILGTDLAGKDHFANVVSDAAADAGLRVERRRGWLCARPDRQRTSEGKSWFRLGLERLFLATLPLHCRLLPALTGLLLFVDVRLFRRPAGGLTLVVSHTAVRLLAIACGHLVDRAEAISLPRLTVRGLGAMRATGVRVVVLDIDHAVRVRRLADRCRRATVDHFDRYMGSDPVRSERIEACLVHIACTWLGATRIDNNDRTPAELLAHLERPSGGA
ncbi:MAG: hypothetical protein KA768_05145 [Desulfobulbus sp.]|nr:hypothetical protein [Desulfobulbus sp.]